MEKQVMDLDSVTKDFAGGGPSKGKYYFFLTASYVLAVVGLFIIVVAIVTNYYFALLTIITSVFGLSGVYKTKGEKWKKVNLIPFIANLGVLAIAAFLLYVYPFI